MIKKVVRNEEELRDTLREELTKGFLQLETADGYVFTPIDLDNEVDRILSNEGDVSYPVLSCIECTFAEIGFGVDLLSNVLLFNTEELLGYIEELKK
jgi:hypothetical protein